jgi:signal peptidase I
MLGLFQSVEKKTRTHAAHWLELADKVYHFRRDLLSQGEVQELTGRATELRRRLKEMADAAELKLGIERLEEVLRRTGGSFYPKSGWAENVEFFLVAAIVILGIRTYFVQPFKIPTNSMWPSYYGMTAEVFVRPVDEPGLAMKAVRFLAFGAVHHQAPAPGSGEVAVAFFADSRGNPVSPAYTEKQGRKWFVLPAPVREYAFAVDGQVVKLEVPADFDFSRLLSETLQARQKAGDLFRAKPQVHRTPEGAPASGDPRIKWVDLGYKVKTGEPVVSFDILTGDQLFVDRVSYHFVRPSVGDGFVFRTRNLQELHRLMPGAPRDQYYIKRLVGLPGDRLSIRDFTLYRNGQPIEGSDAFASNASRKNKYPGYRDEGRFSGGAEVEVPGDAYMALGDNSANSLDGRFWGGVPEKDVVGRPLWIYYPFTRRWGPAP